MYLFNTVEGGGGRNNVTARDIGKGCEPSSGGLGVV